MIQMFLLMSINFNILFFLRLNFIFDGFCKSKKKKHHLCAKCTYLNVFCCIFGFLIESTLYYDLFTFIFYYTLYETMNNNFNINIILQGIQKKKLQYCNYSF